jgi:hypothetical protein
MWKAQRLAQSRELPAPTVLGKVGRVWVNVTKPKRRRAVAEKIAINARTDWQNADTIIRAVYIAGPDRAAIERGLRHGE